ncbi:hypothetical protein JAK28_12810 [Stenotrophomonas maltophilia]|nr:hypothetical protein [Stenotrophomonas maltophilia]
MSNDNKTLADVQPGGRVRLGDQAERARFEEFLSRNPLTALRAGTAWEVWQAALSAQPSPGGQGDVLDLDRVLSLADVHAEESREDGVRLLDRGGLLAFAQDVAAVLAARQPVDEVSVKKEDANNYCLILRALGMEEEGDPVAEVQALIEARDRQPVGEPVIDYEDLVDQAKDLIQCGCSVNGAFDWLLEQLTDGEALAAPPAQAVDLADFKALYRAYVRLLESGRDRILDLGGTCDPVDVMEANDVDLQAARRVLDSQGVGNG